MRSAASSVAVPRRLCHASLTALMPVEPMSRPQATLADVLAEEAFQRADRALPR